MVDVRSMKDKIGLGVIEPENCLIWVNITPF